MKMTKEEQIKVAEEWIADRIAEKKTLPAERRQITNSLIVDGYMTDTTDEEDTVAIAREIERLSAEDADNDPIAKGRRVTVYVAAEDQGRLEQLQADHGGKASTGFTALLRERYPDPAEDRKPDVHVTILYRLSDEYREKRALEGFTEPAVKRIEFVGAVPESIREIAKINQPTNYSEDFARVVVDLERAMPELKERSNRSNIYKGKNVWEKDIDYYWEIENRLWEHDGPRSMVELIDLYTREVKPAWEHARQEKTEKTAAESARRAKRYKAAREREEREAEQAAEQEKMLRIWAQKFGSDLLKMRIKGDFAWIALAETEWADRALKGAPLEEYVEEYDDDHDYATPSLENLQAMEALEEFFEQSGIDADCEIRWVVYRPEYDEDGYEERKGHERPEIFTKILCPNGRKRIRRFRAKLAK